IGGVVDEAAWRADGGKRAGAAGAGAAAGEDREAVAARRDEAARMRDVERAAQNQGARGVDPAELPHSRAAELAVDDAGAGVGEVAGDVEGVGRAGALDRNRAVVGKAVGKR